MGEVYKARDTRLERPSPSRSCPPRSHRSPFRERFEREAKRISALNHRTSARSTTSAARTASTFLVMEYLEGETLAARLAKGPLPLAQAIDIGDRRSPTRSTRPTARASSTAISNPATSCSRSPAPSCSTSASRRAGPATAARVQPHADCRPMTDAAHDAGHDPRDLPVHGARAGRGRGGRRALGHLRVRRACSTRCSRASKAFTGKSQASLFGAILKEEPPPVSSVQPLTPPSSIASSGRASRRIPTIAIQTAHDLLLQLQWVAEGGSAAGMPAPIVAHRRHRERAAWVALAVVTIGNWLATLVPAWKGVRAPLQAPPVQFTVMSSATANTGPWPPLISPDGRTLMFLSPTSRPKNQRDDSGFDRLTPSNRARCPARNRGTRSGRRIAAR